MFIGAGSLSTNRFLHRGHEMYLRFECPFINGLVCNNTVTHKSTPVVEHLGTMFTRFSVHLVTPVCVTEGHFQISMF